jgi:hypothetical protein
MYKLAYSSKMLPRLVQEEGAQNPSHKVFLNSATTKSSVFHLQCLLRGLTEKQPLRNGTCVTKNQEEWTISTTHFSLPTRYSHSRSDRNDVPRTDGIYYELVGHLPREGPNSLIPCAVDGDYVLRSYGLDVRNGSLNQLGFGPC